MGELFIRWIGQSGYLLRGGDTVICLDPYLSDVVERVAGRGRMVPPPFPPEELRCDAVVCTHDHLDHLDIDAIPRMKRDGVPFLAPTAAEDTLRACGATLLLPFDEGMSYGIGDFRLTAVFADHSVPAVGVIVEYRGTTLYFTGDTEYHERLTEVGGGIDMLLVCINGRLGNMTAEEAAGLTERIAPRVGVPTHYGMFGSNTADPREYLTKIKNGFEMAYNVEYSVKEILGNV